MKRPRFLRFLVVSIAWLPGACDDSPIEPEITRLPIGTVTAAFDGLEVELLKYNLSWFPRDESPRPSEDEIFTTFLVRIRNGAPQNRAIRPSDYRYRTLIFPPGTGPVWDPFDGGRIPRLGGRTLDPAEQLQGWVTYRVPKGDFPDELLWSPRRDVVIAIYLPPAGSASRFERALVFGRVTDPERNPVPGAEVRVTSVDPDISGDPSEVGNCRGFADFAEETRTDRSGWYSAPLESLHASRLCIDVLAVAPSGSGLADARAGGGTVVPDQETAFAEAPEIRIDVVLPRLP